jgi:hypothetical protein
MARRPSRLAAPTYGAAGLLFVGAVGGLAVQVSAGEDPALGAPVAQAALAQPHYVVTRRVERRRVVVRRVRDLPPLPAPAAPTGGGVAASPGYSAPVAVSAPSAPVSSGGGGGSSAPAPAPVAVAPAPAAPVPAPVTRAS